jgi:hypothetical protein
VADSPDASNNLNPAGQKHNPWSSVFVLIFLGLEQHREQLAFGLSKAPFFTLYQK